MTSGDPAGSGPGYRSPMLVVQSDEFNESAIRTSVCATITSNMRLAAAPGNVRISRRVSRLPNDSVVNVSQLITFCWLGLAGIGSCSSDLHTIITRRASPIS
jgi:mRNA-degrading endonuclease toxin of MazEF toxin-antitoxin module